MPERRAFVAITYILQGVTDEKPFDRVSLPIAYGSEC